MEALAKKRQEEIRKLARAFCDESDAAILELGLSSPDQLVPFDLLPTHSQMIYEKMAERIYKRLLFIDGVLVVIEKKGDRLL